MSDRSVIEGSLRALADRRRWQRAWHGGWRGGAWGTVAWCVWVAVYKVLPISETGVAWGWWGMVVGGVIGAMMGWWRRWTVMEAARWLESREEMPQTLSTAVEMMHDPKASPAWRELVEGRAAAEVRKVRLGRVLPWRLPVAARWMGVVLLAVWVLGGVPEHRSPSRLRAEKETERVTETGRRLAQLVERTLTHQPPEDEKLRELLEEVRSTGERLAGERLSREDAVRELSRVTERIREEAQALAAAKALRSLQREARRPAEGGFASGDRTGGRSLAMKSVEESVVREAMEALSRQWEQVREKAKRWQSDPSSASAEQAMKEVLEGWQAAAGALGGMGEGLQGAMEAMRGLGADQVMTGLEGVEREMEGWQERMEGMDGMDGTESEVGSGQAWAAWAERLEQGQLAVRNSEVWSLGVGEGMGQGGWAKAGSSGRGEGSGVEEGHWFFPKMAGGGGMGGDRAGSGRSDLDLQEATEGVEGAISEGTVSVRVRGAWTPGPMPSVSLKGLNLRGQSTVEYREAVAAAQSEAERALSQDTVPRAYRASVRGYFDDLE